jgi:hypothetical protein
MENKTMFQQAYDAVEKMNNGLTDQDFDRGCFSIETIPGEEFIVLYGNVQGRIAFCGSENIVDPEEDDLKRSVHQQIIDCWISEVQNPIKKIKTESYSVSKESRELIDAIVDFAEEMKKRLILKAQQGRGGWKNHTTNDIIQEIYNRLKRLEAGETKVDIGIANWALIHFMNRTHTVMEELTSKPKEETLNKDRVIYYLKGNPYKKIIDSKIKMEGVLYAIGEKIGRQYLTQDQFLQLRSEWLPVTIYETLYDNPDGRLWVRTVDEFNQKFNTEEELRQKGLVSEIKQIEQKQEEQEVISSPEASRVELMDDLTENENEQDYDTDSSQSDS